MGKPKSICFFVALALTAILAPGQSRPSGIASLALMHVTVIDGTGAPPRPDMADSLKFTEDHLWIRVDGKRAQIGISDYGQSELGGFVGFGDGH